MCNGASSRVLTMMKSASSNVELFNQKRVVLLN
jgi:hypothetical protein